MLRTLFPDARVVLDESYRIVQLERDRVVDRFEDLSDGAREQVGIIGRLALADVLADGDRVCVLLDDALAFTSDRRFARMASVMALASCPHADRGVHQRLGALPQGGRGPRHRPRCRCASSAGPGGAVRRAGIVVGREGSDHLNHRTLLPRIGHPDARP